MKLSFCSLSSGSQGNSYLIRSESSAVLIDAGISAKRITEGLHAVGADPSELKAILITHEHTDHTKGVAVLSKKHGIPVYANESTWKACGPLTSEERQKTFRTGEYFSIGDIDIKAFPTSHDAAESVGFSLFKNGVQVSTLTDTGYISDEMLQEILHADILALEANHDAGMLKIGRYPWFLKQRILGERGHMSNEDTGAALVKLLRGHSKNRQILLAHLSHENNFPQMAYQTVKNILEDANYYIGKHFTLDTIIREEISRVYSA